MGHKGKRFDRVEKEKVPKINKFLLKAMNDQRLGQKRFSSTV